MLVSEGNVIFDWHGTIELKTIINSKFVTGISSPVMVRWLVGFLAGLHKNFLIDFDEILIKGVFWPNPQLIWF